MRNAEVDFAISVTALSAGTAHDETTSTVVKVVIGPSHFIPGLRSFKIHIGIFIRYYWCLLRVQHVVVNRCRRHRPKSQLQPNADRDVPR